MLHQIRLWRRALSHAVWRSGGLSIGGRLTLGLAPALLALALLAGLAYYGERGRQIPPALLIAAAVLTLLSVWGTWRNTQDIARRIHQVADDVALGTPSRMAPRDDLGLIKDAVDDLGAALAASEALRLRADAEAEARLREQATMLSVAVADAIARLDELRLPLHILVETPFGMLNENQEELVTEARTAAEALDLALRHLREYTAADRGSLTMLRDRVSLNETISGMLPLMRAHAARLGAEVQFESDPTLPRIRADRTRLAEALALIGSTIARLPTGDASVQVSTRVDRGMVWTIFHPYTAHAATREMLVAKRLITAQEGAWEEGADSLSVGLPLAVR